MTILYVARHLNAKWDSIKKIQQRGLSRGYAKSKPKHLRYITIMSNHLHLANHNLK